MTVKPPPRPRFVWRQPHWDALLLAGKSGNKSGQQLADELRVHPAFAGQPRPVLNSSTVRREWARTQDSLLAAGGEVLPALRRHKTGPDAAQLALLLQESDHG